LCAVGMSDQLPGETWWHARQGPTAVAVLLQETLHPVVGVPLTNLTPGWPKCHSCDAIDHGMYVDAPCMDRDLTYYSQVLKAQAVLSRQQVHQLQFGAASGPVH